MKILSVNAGSSSYKLSFYDLKNEDPVEPLWKGEIEWGRHDIALHLTAKKITGESLNKDFDTLIIEEAIHLLLQSLWQGETQVIDGPQAIDRIGHRVVHGGKEFERPTLINEKVKEQIRQLIPLAPLHNPANLQGIEWMEKFFPTVCQIALFDTAFHVTMPQFIKTYPVPIDWKQKGVQRYGFHGISHHYCAERVPKFLKKNPTDLKIINCHLGNGCSLCAIQDGKSFETTMGLTPIEGLMMGTRCGSIDPGIILYLMREHDMSYQEVEKALNFSSGLKGICGTSDMRDVLMRQEHPEEQLAIEMFVHRLKTSIGAMAVSLGGFDVLSFTGGIGENAAWIREKTCLGLSCLGVAIDEEKNLSCQADADISIDGSLLRVLVLQTLEEWMIARSCLVFRMGVV